MKNNFEVPKNQLVKLAKKYSLKELALFGSVLTTEFGAESDIDVLIEFESSAKASLFDLVEIKEELVGTVPGTKHTGSNLQKN